MSKVVDVVVAENLQVGQAFCSANEFFRHHTVISTHSGDASLRGQAVRDVLWLPGARFGRRAADVRASLRICQAMGKDFIESDAAAVAFSAFLVSVLSVPRTGLGAE